MPQLNEDSDDFILFKDGRTSQIDYLDDNLSQRWWQR